jgi:hypothetical protein
MARHQNVNWPLPENQMESWQQVEVAVLMDIRDELQRLNTLLRCPNFQQIPAHLETIKRNTAKPKVKVKKQ